MKPFDDLINRYQSDAAFNKMVNLFRRLIEEHGFVSSEIREGVFLAQYLYEMGRAERVVRTEKEWQQIHDAREALKTTFANIQGKE